MKVLWISGLSLQVQHDALENVDHGAQVEGVLVAHFPPPQDIELHVACLWPGGSIRKDFIYRSVFYHLLPCHKRGRATTFFFFDHLFYKKLFKELKPDLVHAWGTEDSSGMVAMRLAPVHHLLSTQGFINQIIKHSRKTIRYRIAAITEKSILTHLKNIAAENEFAVEQVNTLTSKKDGNITIIDYPVKCEFLQASPSDGKKEKAIFVGRITQEKGYEDCLMAFARAAPSTWKLHIIGAGSRESEKHLHRLASDLGIKDRFQHDRFLSVTGLVEALKSSSIFLLPTYIEGGCMALKEALTMGLWPACYDNSGPGIYIRKFRFGSLAKDRDRDDLCNVLRRCIEEKSWMEEPRRTDTIEMARGAFNPGTIWQQLKDLYLRITG